MKVKGGDRVKIGYENERILGVDLEFVFGLIFRWILVARLIGALVFTAVLWVRKKWAWVI